MLVAICQWSKHVSGVNTSLDYFIENGFFIFLQWLNPGYSDTEKISTGSASSIKFFQCRQSYQCGTDEIIQQHGFKKSVYLFTHGRYIAI